MKIFLIIFSLSIFACKGDYPKPTRQIRLFYSNSFTQEVCWDRNESITECILTSDPRFDEFFSIHKDDYAYSREYLQLLIKSCKEWKK